MTKHMLRSTFEIFGWVDVDEMTQKIHNRMINLIYEQLTGAALFVESIVATVVVIVLWGSFKHSLLIGWLLYIFLVSGLGRKLLRNFYFKKEDLFSDATWAQLFSMATFCSSAAWGFLSLFLMPSEDIILQTFVVFIIFGVSAVANNLYAPIISIYFLFLILAFSPLTAWFFLQGGAYTFLGFMSFLYVAVMVRSAYNNNKLLINSLKLRFKNLELVSSEKQLNEQLISASRYAGMADVATNVLHNIGNVLTSVNTSISIIRTRISTSKVGNLEKISELLKAHHEDIGIFLTTDHKGKRVPSYLETLAQTWIKDKESLLDEITSLTENINHIKEIINQQNALCMATGVLQKISIPEVVEDAVSLNQISFIKTYVQIIREYSTLKPVKIDRVKLLQIVVNLIKNSIESLLDANITNRQIRLRIYQQDDSYFVIEVNDNGLGISSENLKWIFLQGFTTKKKGHGFGLHSSAIAAVELGGKLSVESEGASKGARFKLKLPFKSKPE